MWQNSPVSRSNLYERPELAPEKRGPYTKLMMRNFYLISIEIVDSGLHMVIAVWELCLIANYRKMVSLV